MSRACVRVYLQYMTAAALQEMFLKAVDLFVPESLLWMVPRLENGEVKEDYRDTAERTPN